MAGEANIWNPRTLLQLSGDTKSIEQRLVASSGQTLFTITEFIYVVDTGALEVHKNGLLLAKGIDWVEETSTTFRLVAPSTTGDEVVATGKVGITGSVDIRDTDIYVINYQAIRDYVGTEITLYSQGRVTHADGGETFFQKVTGAAPGFYVDNNIDIIVPTGGNGSIAWIRRVDIINADDFGAVGDFVADDTVALQAWIDHAGALFSSISTPRVGALKLFLPHGHYKISAPLIFSFGSAGEFSSIEIFGESVVNGSIIEGTHAGALFQYSSGELCDIHHLSFRGAGCTAFNQTLLTARSMQFNFHHLDFDANLLDCFVGNYLITTWEYNNFGTFGIPGAIHRHIRCIGDTVGIHSNLNTVRRNRFTQGKGAFPIDILTGDNWWFEGNNIEGNTHASIKIVGSRNISFNGDWFENNTVTATGHEMEIDDVGILFPRVLTFNHCHIGATAGHTHWVKATSAGALLSIRVENNVGSGFPAGFKFTEYNAVDEDGVTKWMDNTLASYSHPDFEITKYQMDAFSANVSSDVPNVTGDGTTYTVVFDTVDVLRLAGTYASGTGIHTTATAGIYSYKATIQFNGALAGHTNGTLKLITTGGTFLKQFDPIDLGVSGDNSVSIAHDALMGKNDTAKIELTVAGGTKVIDVKGTSAGLIRSYFSGHRIANA